MIKFHVNLSQYEVLELEGVLINKESAEENTTQRLLHIDNGQYSTFWERIKKVNETWIVKKTNNNIEVLQCNALYEDNRFSRTCDKISKMAVENGPLWEYGPIKEGKVEECRKKPSDIRKILERELIKRDVVDIMPITIFQDKNIYRVTCDGDKSYIKEFNKLDDAIEEAWKQSNVSDLILYLNTHFDNKTDMAKYLIELQKNGEDYMRGVCLGDSDISHNTYSISDVLVTAWNSK